MVVLINCQPVSSRHQLHSSLRPHCCGRQGCVQTSICCSHSPAPLQQALLRVAAAAAALSLSTASALATEDLTITFRASRNPEISRVQRALVEAWGMLGCIISCDYSPCICLRVLTEIALGSSGYVETQFMDPELDHRQWKNELQVHTSRCIDLPDMLVVLLFVVTVKQQVHSANPFLPHVSSTTINKALFQESINASYKAATASEAYVVTDKMLSSLGKLHRPTLSHALLRTPQALLY